MFSTKSAYCISDSLFSENENPDAKIIVPTYLELQDKWEIATSVKIIAI